MINRRKFLSDSTKYSASAILFSGLLSCKNQNSKESMINLKEIVKHLKIADGASYQMNYIQGNVGFFSESGGTIAWLVNKEGIVIVDTQFPETSQHLVQEIHSLTDRKLDLLINTHHHHDHTAGNVVYKELTNRILAHENSLANQKRVAEANGQTDVVLPNETFYDQRKEVIGGENIHLTYHGAAHTDGDILVHFEDSGVVHLGDLVFNRKYPYIDKSSGASIGGWIVALDKINTMFEKDTKFICGHAGEGYNILITKDDITAFRVYLENLLVFGQKSISAGMSLEEVLETAKAIPGSEEWKGEGIDRSIKAVYTELTS